GVRNSLSTPSALGRPRASNKSRCDVDRSLGRANIVVETDAKSSNAPGTTTRLTVNFTNRSIVRSTFMHVLQHKAFGLVCGGTQESIPGLICSKKIDSWHVTDFRPEHNGN